MMKMNKAREDIVKLFIGCLNRGEIPWYQGFVPLQTSFNPVTNTTYKNSNKFILYLHEVIHKYNDPRWMTYNQAKEKGYSIKKGSKGVHVEYWSLYDTKNRKAISKAEALEIVKQDEQRKKDITYISRVYTVFNGTQIEGIPEYKHNISNIEFEEKKYEIPLSVIKDFCSNVDLTLVEKEKLEVPYYQPLKDVVAVPSRCRYIDEGAYFSDTFHEIAHATGHKNRLNRNLANAKDQKAYALEELRAEIGSAFICNCLGIVSKPNRDYLKNSVAYVQAFLKILDNDPNELFKAIKDANKIADYVLENGEYAQKDKLRQMCNRVLDKDEYEPNLLSFEEMEKALLPKDILCVDKDEAENIIREWSDDKEEKTGHIFYCFDDEEITCLDNRDGNLYMQRFEPKDCLLAYMWMNDMVDSADCYKLTHSKEGAHLSGK